MKEKSVNPDDTLEGLASRVLTLEISNEMLAKAMDDIIAAVNKLGSALPPAPAKK